MKTIVADHLSKSYGRFVAVDDATFEVEEGEVFGFLGPNGAGKTTTIKMLNTLLPITKGKASICGFDVAKEGKEVRKRIGLVPQDLTLDRDITGRKNLMIQAKLYRLEKETAKTKMAELLKFSGLEKVADKEVMSYSGGMQKRLELVMGFVHTPRVLFLDEPTLGLDAQSRLNIWEYIRKLNKEFKVTIFLTTHYLDEADQLCDRISIIDGGRIRASGTPKELKGTLGGELLILKLAPTARGDDVKRSVEELPGVLDVTWKEDRLLVEAKDAGNAIPEVVLRLAALGANVQNVEVAKRNLDQVFLKYVGHSAYAQDDGDALRAFAKEKVLEDAL